MLVDAQVSSMNTRRSGSRSSWSSNQASRRFRTSRRSCSEACAVFFTRELVTAAEAPERGHADLRPLAGKLHLQLGQGQVRHLIEGGADQAGMGLDLVREPVT